MLGRLEARTRIEVPVQPPACHSCPRRCPTTTQERANDNEEEGVPCSRARPQRWFQTVRCVESEEISCQRTTEHRGNRPGNRGSSSPIRQTEIEHEIEERASRSRASVCVTFVGSGRLRGVAGAHSPGVCRFRADLFVKRRFHVW